MRNKILLSNVCIPDKPLRILAAEDCKINSQIIRHILKNHMVTVVETGEKIIELLKTGSFYDLVILDIRMPGIDGYQAAEMIRNPKTGISNPDIPLIAISAGTTEDEQEKIEASGLNGYVGKPLTADSLLSEICRVMASGNNHISRDNPCVEFAQKPYRFSGKHLSDSNLALEAGCESGPWHSCFSMADFQEAAEMMGGKNRILIKVCKSLLEEIPRKIKYLKINIQKDNKKEIERIAHSLKSGAKCVCAEKASNAAWLVEMAAQADDMQQIGRIMADLEELFGNLHQEIRRYLKA